MAEHRIFGAVPKPSKSLQKELDKLDAKLSKVNERIEKVNHPVHYGGADNPYEAIKVIEAWDLGFCLGNTVKYISRAGKKIKTKKIEDLQKAAWYLNREIKKLEKRK